MPEMDIDFAAVLTKWSSWTPRTCTSPSGAPPMVRVRGELQALDGYPQLTSKDTRDIIYSILSNDQRKRLEQEWQVDFSYSVPRMGRFRVNAYMQRASVGGGVPPDPVRDQVGRPARACRPWSTSS